MGLEEIISNENSLEVLTAQGFSLSLLGVVAGGVAGYMLGKKIEANFKPSIRAERSRERKSYSHAPLTFVPVVTAIVGAYSGYVLVSYAGSILSSVLQRM